MYTRSQIEAICLCTQIYEPCIGIGVMPVCTYFFLEGPPAINKKHAVWQVFLEKSTRLNGLLRSLFFIKTNCVLKLIGFLSIERKCAHSGQR